MLHNSAMKRLLLGMILVLILGVPAFGQDVPNIQEISLPEINVTLADVVGILTEFDVVSENSYIFCTQYYGVTDFDHKTISICSRYDTAVRQRTILHEILHIMYWKRGVFTGGPYELLIDRAAQKLFHTLYGFQK